jgi:hypothetical protein
MKHILFALVLLFVASTAFSQFPKITSKVATFTTARDSIYFSTNGAWGSVNAIHIGGADTLQIWVNDDTAAANTWYLIPSKETSINAVKIKHIRVHASSSAARAIIQIKP